MHCETLPLADADLRFWQRVDLGEDPDRLLSRLIDECAWRQEEITLYGKTHAQPRLSAWYGDRGYRYSGIRLEPAAWTESLQALRERVEQLAGHSFNSVLLNYYRDGQDRMGMHSDDEKELGPRPVIASLSLGATRCFLLRHRSRKDLGTLKLQLPGGSLLVMQGETQRYWRHAINSERHCRDARINLTFRQILANPAEAS